MSAYDAAEGTLLGNGQNRGVYYKGSSTQLDLLCVSRLDKNLKPQLEMTGIMTVVIDSGFLC